MRYLNDIRDIERVCFIILFSLAIIILGLGMGFQTYSQFRHTAGVAGLLLGLSGFVQLNVCGVFERVDTEFYCILLKSEPSSIKRALKSVFFCKSSTGKLIVVIATLLQIFSAIHF